MAVVAAQLQFVLSRMDYGRSLKQELLMGNRTDLHVPYAQPLLDAVGLFDRLKIGYALIGGIASMYYGRSRFTEDVDFVAASGHMILLSANPAVMEEFHFSPDCVHKLYHKSGISVDIWKDQHADRIIGEATEVSLAGRSVRMIEPHQLIAMKLRAGRLKDDYDISQILLATPIDEARLAGLADPQQMQHFQQIKARSE